MPAETAGPIVLNVIRTQTVPEICTLKRQSMGKGNCYCSCVQIRDQGKESKAKCFVVCFFLN